MSHGSLYRGGKSTLRAAYQPRQEGKGLRSAEKRFSQAGADHLAYFSLLGRIAGPSRSPSSRFSSPLLSSPPSRATCLLAPVPGRGRGPAAAAAVAHAHVRMPRASLLVCKCRVLWSRCARGHEKAELYQSRPSAATRGAAQLFLVPRGVGPRTGKKSVQRTRRRCIRAQAWRCITASRSMRSGAAPSSRPSSSSRCAAAHS